MEYQKALDALLSGSVASRPSWGCKTIRQGKESDADYIPNVENIESFVIEDCKERVCDCSIGVFRPTDEDKQAVDYFIING